MLNFFYLSLGLFLFLPLAGQGACLNPSPLIKSQGLNVVINEIAWMGTNASYSDEWIELYNNSDYAIDIKNWKLEANDKSPEIFLKGQIPAKGFFLLERTNDETLPDIKADLIYKGNLSNKGEYLKIINGQGEVIDEIDCSSKWFTGDNKAKRTMERINSLVFGSNPENWQTGQNPGGTPKSKNSPGLALIKPAEDGPLQARQADLLSYKYLGNTLSEGGHRAIVLLIAFALAVLSAATILILKKAATRQG